VEEPVVVSARVRRLGEGAEAGAARARQPARDALDGLERTGVGIHGTDEPTSIGYSASHGCIRMQVPDAEWLFDHVDVGTTVYIV
jgi:lipoprotein-anchoring transpeptidase ErfK/SrfK